MKKALTLVLAVLLLVSLLPLTVMADTEAPLPTDQAQVKVYYATKKYSTLTLKADTGAAYMAVKEDGTFGPWEGAEAPADKFVKFEYTAGEPATVKATFQNLNVDLAEALKGGYTYHTIEFLKGGAPYNVEIELIGENSMTQTKSASIKYSNEGTMTISGSGSMSLTMNGAGFGCIWGNGGDLTIKNTTMTFTVNPGDTNSPHHAIFMGKGSVTLEGAKLNSTVRGGAMVWLGTTVASKGRSQIDTDPSRVITAKNCEITSHARVGSIFVSTSPAVVSGCTMRLSKDSVTGREIFVPAPTFEGDYTVVAGLFKNADKPEKLKPYKPGQLSSYTFMSVVPYVVETTPPETEAPEIETPDVETPDVETPDVETPDVETPDVETPDVETTEATQPTTEATQPETQAPTTEATEPVDTDGESSGNPLKVVVIIIVVLVVLAGAAVAALFILKKKGIIK